MTMPCELRPQPLCCMTTAQALPSTWPPYMLRIQVELQVYTVEGNAAESDSASRVVSIDCHRSAPHLFLAAHDSGIVCLHHSGVAGAVRTWACREDVIAALWLSECSLQFLAVHSDGSVATCDAARTEATPLAWATVQALGPSVVHAAVWRRAGDDSCAWLLLCSARGVQMHRILVLENALAAEQLDSLEYWGGQRG